MTRYRCSKCPYVYDPRKGDPDGGIPPGTPFDRIPASWRCPICGARKSDFIPLAPPADEAPAARPAPMSAPAAADAPVPMPAALDRPPAEWTVGSLRGVRQG